MSRRVIRFRGINSRNGKWVYGDSIKHTDNPAGNGQIEDIVYIGHKVPDARKCGAMKWLPVDSDTVGQFTGIYDRNGREVFEGDIVLAKSAGECRKCQVVYVEHSCSFILQTKIGPWYIHADIDTKKDTLLEIIGNIHDNPDIINR